MTVCGFRHSVNLGVDSCKCVPTYFAARQSSMSFVYYSIVLDGGSDSSLMALGRNSVLVGASAFDFRSQIEFVSLIEVTILYD